MTHEDIAKIAKEAGCIPRRHPEYDNDVQVFATPDVLMQFAKLVIANNPPQSFMTWHEGYAAGAAAEREACAKVCDDVQDCGPENGCCPTYWNEALDRAAANIRARGKE